MLQVIYVICSPDMPWHQLPHYLIKLLCQVTAIRSKGFCFLYAVSMTLAMDHDEVITLDKMQSSVLDHMASSVNCYKLFHEGHVLKDMKRYFKLGTYCDSVLNLIVIARARALNLNLKIYQKGPKGNIQIPEHITHPTAKEAHLKFTCDTSNAAHYHYEVIFPLDEPTQRHTEEEVSIESPCKALLIMQEAKMMLMMWLTWQMILRWQPLSNQTHFQIIQAIMSCNSLFTYFLRWQLNRLMNCHMT